MSNDALTKLNDCIASRKIEIVQDGKVVVTIDAPTPEEAAREAMHYAMVYAQDGPVSIRAVLPSKGQ